MGQPEFVEVASKATGQKRRVPAHWLDHPVLSIPFRRLASETKRRQKAEAEQQEPEVVVDPEGGAPEPDKG